MKDRDALRLEKIRQRDRLLEEVYVRLPELEKIDREVSVLYLKLARFLSLHDKENCELIKSNLEDLQAKHQILLRENGLSSSIYEPQWDCSKCQDLGYISAGELCECFRNEKILENAKKGNITQGLREKTFANFSYHYYENKEEIKNRVAHLKAFTHRMDKMVGENFILIGDVGRGKTHLALACANAILDDGGTVLYYSVSDFLEEIRMLRYDEDHMSPKEVFSRFLAPDLLIIDDLGAEAKVSDFSLTQLTLIINERNQHHKSWIVTTNYSLGELERRYDARLLDRLLENTRIITMSSGESIRLLKRKVQKEKESR